MTYDLDATVISILEIVLPSECFTATDGKMADLRFELGLIYIIGSPDITKCSLCKMCED